jgi:hypothetical protein
VKSIQQREAKVVFAGAAPLSKGTAIHLEYPRTGQKLGAIAEDNKQWLNPNLIKLPSANIVYIAREADIINGPYQWTGRSQGMIEAIVRNCQVDEELGHTILDVDIVAERQINVQGQVMTHNPLW